MQVDLAGSEEELQAIERSITAINATAHVIPTQRCKVPLERLLGRGGFVPSDHLPELGRVSARGDVHEHEHGTTTASDRPAQGPPEGHAHDAGIGTMSLRATQAVSLTRQAPSLLMLWELSGAVV